MKILREATLLAEKAASAKALRRQYGSLLQEQLRPQYSWNECVTRGV